MGMAGHAVVRREDGGVFAHLHPAGTISMAAQEMFAGETRTQPMNQALRSHEVEFPYAFPRAGAYRLWVQVRKAGRIETGVFDVAVSAAK
jgi:hypothetical protein